MKTFERKIEFRNWIPTSVKSIDERAGIVEAIVGVTNNIDLGGDLMVPGVFQASLDRGRVPKGLAVHEWPRDVAKTEEARELLPGSAELPERLRAKGFGGAYIVGRYNLDPDDIDARQCFSRIKFHGADQEWSIGFYTEQESRDETGNRHVEDIDWIEWSSVLLGMNPETITIATKALSSVPTEVSQWFKSVSGVRSEELSEWIGAAVKGEVDPTNMSERQKLERAWNLYVETFDLDVARNIDRVVAAVKSAAEAEEAQEDTGSKSELPPLTQRIELDTTDFDRKFARVTRALGVLGAGTEKAIDGEPSFSEIREAIEAELGPWSEGENSDIWVCEISSTHFVFIRFTETGNEYFKGDYSYDSESHTAAVSNVVEVEREVEYVPVTELSEGEDDDENKSASLTARQREMTLVRHRAKLTKMRVGRN